MTKEGELCINEPVGYVVCIMSPLWRHTVLWCHPSHVHLTQHRRFPIRPQLKSNPYDISLTFHMAKRLDQCATHRHTAEETIMLKDW